MADVADELIAIVLDMYDGIHEATKPSNILDDKDLDPDSPLRIPQDGLEKMWESWNAMVETHRVVVEKFMRETGRVRVVRSG